MPRFPEFDAKAATLGGSVFSALAGRIAALEGEVYGFHVGDTWMQPPPGAAWVASGAELNPQPHRYANPAGIAPLLSGLADKISARTALPATPQEILVTPGATGALTAACQAVLSAGDEVLVLAPYWPLIRGIVHMAGATVVEVPVLHSDFTGASLREALEARMTARTAAVYVNTPCNPTGGVLAASELSVIAEFARARGLWVLSDEVYEDYVFEGVHVSTAQLLPEQTISAYSFSKGFGMTGYRVGYLFAPRAVIERARKVSTYAWYSVATPAQYAAQRALGTSADWIATARGHYEAAGGHAAATLGLAPPRGSTFLFFDVARALDDRGLAGFLEDCLDDNLILAPGPSFGAGFETWVRLCFTSMPPDVTARGVEMLAQRLR